MKSRNYPVISIYAPRSAFKWYWNYDALNPTLATHCYLHANNKAEKTSNEESDDNYDKNVTHNKSFCLGYTAGNEVCNCIAYIIGDFVSSIDGCKI